MYRSRAGSDDVRIKKEGKIDIDYKDGEREVATKTFHLPFRQILSFTDGNKFPGCRLFSRYDIDRHDKRERERECE